MASDHDEAEPQESKTMKLGHHGDSELLEEYPGQVEREAERIYLHLDRGGDWVKLSHSAKDQWKRVARRELVKRRGATPEDVSG